MDFERYETIPGLTLNRIKEMLWETIKTFGEERLPLWTRNRYGLIQDRVFGIGHNNNMVIQCFRGSGTELDTHVRIAGPSYDDEYGMGVCLYVNCSGVPFIKITEKYIIYRPDRRGRMLGDRYYKPGSWLVGDTLQDFVALIISTFQRKYKATSEESVRKKHVSELMEQFDILTRNLTRKQLEDIVTTPSLVGIDTSSVPPVTCNFSINLEKIFIDKGDFTMKIKEVTYSGKATIVFWTDGTKTVVKTAEGETFSKDVGLAMAIAEKYFGSYSAMKSYIKRNTKDANEANAKKKQKKEKKED